LKQPGAGKTTIISEYYQLRRTAIKDIASYLGFLAGFIGSAPFAWGRLAVQLDAGRFARGLWYFFGIVTVAGILSGIAGMGIGVAAGYVWEKLHRHRRSSRIAAHAPVTDQPATTADAGAPRLRLITRDPTNPERHERYLEE
jgi:hypothetical protein